jgi:hypothetical protein
MKLPYLIMKKWFRLFLCLSLITPVVDFELTAAPKKQSQKKAQKKKTPAQTKKEVEKKKQIAERAAAARKKKAKMEAAKEQDKKDAELERISIQVAEIQKSIKSASFRLDDVQLGFKKIIDGRGVILQSIARVLAKTEKPELVEARGKLMRIKEQVVAKQEEIKNAFSTLGKLKIMCAKYTDSKKGKAIGKALLESYEKAEVAVKRDFSVTESTIKKMMSYNKNYARVLSPLISELVEAGITFSDKEKELIKKLAYL